MYEVEKREFTDSEIIGGAYPIVTATKIAQGEVKKNAPVKLVNGKAKVVTKGTSTQETVTGLYGIAAQEAENGDELVIYLTGEFKVSELELEAGVNADDLEVAYRGLGIFLV